METEKAAAPPGEPGVATGNGAVDLSKLRKKHAGGRPRKIFPAAAPGDSEKHSPPSQGNTLVDAKFLSESAVCLVEIADEVISRTLADRVAKLMPDKLQEFVELQRQVGLNSKDKAMVGMSVQAIALKYSLLTKFGPEILLMAWISQYSIRQARMFRFVSQMAAERSKMEQRGEARPMPAPVPQRH